MTKEGTWPRIPVTDGAEPRLFLSSSVTAVGLGMASVSRHLGGSGWEALAALRKWLLLGKDFHNWSEAPGWSTGAVLLQLVA